METDLLIALNGARRDKQACAVLTHLASGRSRLVHARELSGKKVEFAGTNFSEAIADCLRRDRPEILEAPEGEVFVNVFNPPLRLIVIGAVHISQQLAPMAMAAGFDVTVIDPRGAFAEASRFPGINLSGDWPDEALERLSPDARTAIVTLTHDPKLDDAALGIALKSPAFYIGSLGSRKTHAARLKRLQKAGFGDSDFARISGPIGLDIGAQTPAEIAIAILAEIILTLRGAKR